MVSKQLVFVLFGLCGLFSHTIICSAQQASGETTHATEDEHQEININNFDDNDDVMARLNAVESIDDFVALMTRNGNPVNMNDSIVSPFVDQDGKQVISGGGRLAKPDNCSPRNTTIRISVEGTDSETAFFPRCTRIERCGGCCTSPNVECVPRYTERVILNVLKGRKPYPGATHLEYNGFAPVIVDRHVACIISCKLNAERCGPQKRFIAMKCLCQCRNVTPCSTPTVWDPEECQCKCPVITQCCTNGDDCGMVFNHNLCECGLDQGAMSISIERNRTAPRLPAATPSTTTTTTESTTTPSDPCQNHVCPPRFTKVARGNTCQCRPPSFGGRRRTRNRG